jgi:ribosomal protein L24E
MPKRPAIRENYGQVPAHEIDTSTRVSGDGLRYESKVNGTPFYNGVTGGIARSCLFCGKHRMPTHLTRRRLGGRLFEFCSEVCEKAPKAFRTGHEPGKPGRSNVPPVSVEEAA